MSEIALRHDNAPVTYVSHIPDAARGLVEWAESATAAYELARRLVSTSFAPQQYRGKPEEAAAAMLAGAEVGLSPMASLQAFDVIQGRAAPRAITYRALLLSMGHRLDYVEMSPTKVVVRGLRRGTSEWQTVEWTTKRAADLGLMGKDQWKKQPQTMLIARATAEMARLIAADAILGIPYSIEELADQEPVPTTTVTRAPAAPKTTVSRRKPAPVAEPAEPAFDDAPAEPEAPEQHSDGITDQQLKLMHVLFNEKHFQDRDDRIQYVQQVLEDEEIQSSKELSKDQASRVIDALQQLSGGAE